MSEKKGTLLPNSGTLLPDGLQQHSGEVNYAAAVAAALHRELGNSHGATKMVMRWTGASERTVKNWLAGTKGPSGAHLLVLARYSDAVLEGFLRLAGRKHALIEQDLSEARSKVREVLILLDDLVPMRDPEASKSTVPSTERPCSGSAQT